MPVRRFADLRAQVEARPGARERIEAYRRELLDELSLADLRRARDLTQAELAYTLKTTQSGVSRIERESDLYVSTLRKYVEAMGGQLEIRAVFPDADVPITTFVGLADRTGSPPTSA
jgi:DNA-binding XRE family transcriptional regulator